MSTHEPDGPAAVSIDEMIATAERLRSVIGENAGEGRAVTARDLAGIAAILALLRHLEKIMPGLKVTP